MAKEDFCFTYYDGDAARDKAHMNRLERGAYDDIISAQRKRGHLSIEDIKKVLGGDFETCWPALEWVLITDDQGKYFIEWLENSIEKSRQHSKKQKDNVAKRWNKNGNTKSIPKEQIGITTVIPLGDVYGNGNELREEEGTEGETQKGDPDAYIVPRMVTAWHNQFPKYLLRREVDFPALKDLAFALSEYLAKPKDFSDRSICDEIVTLWNELTTHIAANDHYSKYNLSQVLKYIQSILQSYNRPKAVEKSELQSLYDQYRESKGFSIKKIQEEHYNELHQKNLVTVDEKLIKQSREMRLKILDAPKDQKERELHAAYKSGNPDHPLVKEDAKVIELHAKRTAVIAFFKKQKQANVINLFTENRTA